MQFSGSSRISTIRVGTWNTEWAKPGSGRGNTIKNKLAAPDCDVLCVTEGFAGIFPEGGHVIDAGPDWGYPVREGRRKVLLWSKRPWTDPDTLGSNELPSGRFARGVTQASCGATLTVIGVCIPWRDAHVRTGSKDRKPWQDHEAWLAGFQALRCQDSESRTVVLGDFNQKIPRAWVPHKTHEALLRAIKGFEVATRGALPGAPRLSIDHILHTPDLARCSLGIWPGKGAGGKHLSDHFGVWCDFSM